MAAILIIDDDAQMRRLLREALLRAGHTVQEAADGQQALHCVSDQVPDLVITDLVMPEQEGIETIRYLHSHHPALPIIAISGGGRLGPQNYLPIAAEIGAARCYAKPFRVGEIIDSVRELTRKIE